MKRKRNRASGRRHGKKRHVRISKRIGRGKGAINLHIDINVENLIKENESITDRNVNSLGNGGAGGGGGILGGGGGGGGIGR